MSAGSAEGSVFTGFQAQKETSVDVFRCCVGPGGFGSGANYGW